MGKGKQITDLHSEMHYYFCTAFMKQDNTWIKQYGK